MSAPQTDLAQDIADLWERANDGVDRGRQLEPEIQRLVDEWCGEDDVSLPDFVEFIARRAILESRRAA